MIYLKSFLTLFEVAFAFGSSTQRGIFGSLVAKLGVVLPFFIIVLAILAGIAPHI
ncbi:MAG: hypothetical protein IJW71_03100 [Clostridia bacterium]|nr:hypothetical protein [Clostridia bacterium]